jgi:RES domain-containing protein
LVHVRRTDIIPVLSYCELEIPEHQILPWVQAAGVFGNSEYLALRTQAVLESEVLSRELGDNFIAARSRRPGPLGRRPAVMQVPSVVVPQEWNYLIDPAAENAVRWFDPQPFRIDPRLLDPNLR